MSRFCSFLSVSVCVFDLQDEICMCTGQHTCLFKLHIKYVYIFIYVGSFLISVCTYSYLIVCENRMGLSVRSRSPSPSIGPSSTSSQSRYVTNSNRANFTLYIYVHVLMFSYLPIHESSLDLRQQVPVVYHWAHHHLNDQPRLHLRSYLNPGNMEVNILYRVPTRYVTSTYSIWLYPHRYS